MKSKIAKSKGRLYRDEIAKAGRQGVLPEIIIYKRLIVNTMTTQVPKDLCKQILEFDKTIRFAGIADKFGKIVMAGYRKGSVPLLSKEESVLSFMQTSIRMGTRKTMQAKLGKIVYAFALYEKVKRVTIPLSNYSVLMSSFDIEADHESIISKKILPLVKKHGLSRD